MTQDRKNYHFILVRTQFASNLGSTVRVMKNMGFESLILVQPECEVGMEARSFAMKGADILDKAIFCPTLESAAERVNLLVGTTGRFRGRKPQMIDCRSLAEDVLPRYPDSSVGIVMGSEDNGLRREELRLCQWLVEIPTGSDYSVINLAQASAIVAYELNLAQKASTAPRSLNTSSQEEFDALMKRVDETLERLQVSTRLSVPRLMKRIRKAAGRADLEPEDINMFHGLIKEIEKKL